MRHIKTFTLGFLLALFLAKAAFAEGDNVVKGKYFDVYYNGCDLSEIAQKLDVKYFLHIDVFSQISSGRDINSIIADLFDSIYLEVSDILDIHIYSFKGTICIFPDKAKIKEVLSEYMEEPPNVPAFYFHEKNTIYASSADMTLGVLAHEIAHAIITQYFVVTPPSKVQEVLASYVEYSIRKATGTLPPK
jgi:hypothetical protein